MLVLVEVIVLEVVLVLVLVEVVVLQVVVTFLQHLALLGLVTVSLELSYSYPLSHFCLYWLSHNCVRPHSVFA